MDRYDFIKLGGTVQWFDDSENVIHIMQVCHIVNMPIKGDTQISLIPKEEDTPEEMCNSFSVRANELIPFPTSFRQGYWKAVKEAMENGADEKVLLPMLEGMCFDFSECIYLMLANDTCILYPLLCGLYPEMEEVLEIITWQGRRYPARKMVIFKGTKDEQKILVSVTRLQYMLIDTDSGAPVSEQAEKVDEQIYYYLTDTEMKLSEEMIILMMEGL